MEFINQLGDAYAKAKDAVAGALPSINDVKTGVAISAVAAATLAGCGDDGDNERVVFGDTTTDVGGQGGTGGVGGTDTPGGSGGTGGSGGAEGGSGGTGGSTPTLGEKLYFCEDLEDGDNNATAKVACDTLPAEKCTETAKGDIHEPTNTNWALLNCITGQNVNGDTVTLTTPDNDSDVSATICNETADGQVCIDVNGGGTLTLNSGDKADVSVVGVSVGETQVGFNVE